MNHTDIIAHSGAILARLKAAELTLYEPYGFDEVPKLLAEVGKQYEHPMSSLVRNDFTVGQAFWLFLKKEGQCIATISARHIDLNGENFGSYLKRTSNNQYGTHGDALSKVAEPLEKEVGGRLIYFGGIEFSPEHRGSRRVLADFSHYSKLLAATYWDFDWMYTIIARKHHRLADDYGFHWRVRNAMIWNDPVPEGRENSQMILASSALQLSYDLRTIQPGEL